MVNGTYDLLSHGMFITLSLSHKADVSNGHSARQCILRSTFATVTQQSLAEVRVERARGWGEHAGLVEMLDVVVGVCVSEFDQLRITQQSSTASQEPDMRLVQDTVYTWYTSARPASRGKDNQLGAGRAVLVRPKVVAVLALNPAIEELGHVIEILL